MDPTSPDTQQQPATGWAYNAESTDNHAAPAHPDVEPISWTGSEFIHRQKSPGWYLGLIGIIGVLSAAMWFVRQDWVGIIAIIIAGVLFGIIANRTPQQRAFMIDSQGITVNATFFPYSDFKSFNVLRDDAIGYIDLIPLKRFMPEISLYYAPADEQKIFDTLAHYLPNEQRREHSVDQLMRKLKF